MFGWEDISESDTGSVYPSGYSRTVMKIKKFDRTYVIRTLITSRISPILLYSTIRNVCHNR